MLNIVIDTETDGIENPRNLWSLVVRDADTGKVLSSTHGNHGASIAYLNQADTIIGHNLIGYDLPVLKSLLQWTPRPDQTVRDTLVLARVLHPDLRNDDWKINGFPKELIGSHGLKAWGYRIGVLKGDFKTEDTDWSQWTEEMQSYCEQDTEVTRQLWKRLSAVIPAGARFVEIEHRVASICRSVEEVGFGFDLEGAERLTALLQARRASLKDELVRVFPPKRIQLKTKVREEPFNPGSRDDIVRGLQELHGWEPREISSTRSLKDGRSKTVWRIDDEILGALPYPEAKLLCEYLTVVKRLGQIAEGEEAWLRLCKEGPRGCRLHGRINTNGAVTGRATHSKPNLAQVPGGKKPYSKECRSLFVPRRLWTLVGVDAKGLELRCLAHYLCRWDNGRYAKIVTEGDPHWENAQAFGLAPKGAAYDPATMKAHRDGAKTGIYALIYGAGDATLGAVVNGGAAEGKRLRSSYEKKVPAYKMLKDAVASALQTRGYLMGLDGRPLPARSAHSALNTLLQSAGAVAMKVALIEFYDACVAKGLVFGTDYAIVGWIHDEFQIECRSDIADEIGKTAAWAIEHAGEILAFDCPLDGEFRSGSSWAETH